MSVGGASSAANARAVYIVDPVTGGGAYVTLGNGLAVPTGSVPVRGAVPLLSNGTTLDIQQGNTQGTLLASAPRSTNTTSTTQTNYNARGVALFLNITVASGTGGLTPFLQAPDPVSGTVISLTSGWANQTTTGTKVYYFYPGVAGTSSNAAGFASMPLPRTWQVVIVHGDGSSYTYSLGYSLVV